MASGQNEFGLLVLREGKSGRLVPLQVVAAIATVEVRSGGKLSGMAIGMAVSAALELDLENSVFAFGGVAARALHHGMPALQRIGRGGVVLYREGRRFEAINSVAGSALTAAWTLGKLRAVWIRLVTIRTLLKDQRFPEISVRVASGTFHRGMLAQQRILGV